MQLESTPNEECPPLRDKLARAALALVLLEMPAVAHADSNGPSTQMDVTSLVYNEENRANVFEPVVRVTRLFPDGQSISAQFGLDVITGASPTGALPRGIKLLPFEPICCTNTGASGSKDIPMDQVPTATFSDNRFGFDIDWHKPISRYFTSQIGSHFSKERDYRSLGINGRLSVDLNHRLTTLTFGGAYNHDSVFPIGGTPEGLGDPAVIVSTAENPKSVKNFLMGVSQIVTRRWLVSANLSRTFENGYLTEPYKVISVISSFTGSPLYNVADKRPSTRDRTSLLFDSAYHLSNDVVYFSYRYYRDSWKLHSNTFDLRYRHDVGTKFYFEPHVRYYHQTQAYFYAIQLLDFEPLPDFATADQRLGPLKSVTVGATLGFHFSNSAKEWTVRPEYIRQTGDNHPEDAIGIERTFALSPPLNTFALVVGYSFNL